MSVETTNTEVEPKVSRRRFLRHLTMGLAVPGMGGLYATQMEPFWPQYHEVAMAVKDLPSGFEGMRIAQLTDLHVSNSVPVAYIRAVVREVNRLKPDVVFVTGDLVTRQEGWIKEACDAVALLEAPTYVSLGNHDYGQMFYQRHWIEVSQEIESRLNSARQTVLRNKAVQLRRGDNHLWIMGLEDIWSGRFSPAHAVSRINPPPPNQAHSHNPDTAAALDSD
jgi:predicted MPP superfamily phosphohydrolase